MSNRFYNFIILQLMFFSCFQQLPPIETQFSSVISLDRNIHILEQLPNCQQHHHKIEFVCQEKCCMESSLLCPQCLPDHKDHQWKLASKFFDHETQVTLRTGKNRLSQKIEEATQDLRYLFISFRQQILQKIRLIQSKLNISLFRISHDTAVQFQSTKVIDNDAMKQLLKLKNSERNLEWIQDMKGFLHQALEESNTTIQILMAHLQKTLNFHWELKSKVEMDDVLDQFRRKIILISEDMTDKFLFNKQTKHGGISLSQDLQTATFEKNVPTCPVAILTNCMGKYTNKFSFKVTKLDSKAFIFDASTIFIGVCVPQVVKYVGMRRVNEVSKGAYMIGSTGWCYHHDNKNYDRKNIVGFTFGEGDTIEITLIFETQTLIFFKRGKFQFLNKEFKIPLNFDLNNEKEKNMLYELQPCVSFDGDIGAQVTVYNEPTQEPIIKRRPIITKSPSISREPRQEEQSSNRAYAENGYKNRLNKANMPKRKESDNPYSQQAPKVTYYTQSLRRKEISKQFSQTSQKQIEMVVSQSQFRIKPISLQYSDQKERSRIRMQNESKEKELQRFSEKRRYQGNDKPIQILK